MKVSAKTDKGLVRDNNQDYLFVSENTDLPLFIVADGMGGHKAGEIASKMAVELIRDSFYENKNALNNDEDIRAEIKNSIIEANRKTYLRSLETEDCTGMGTTLTLAYIFEGTIYLGHIGDSRAYLISQNNIEQITEDHSLVNELIKNGSITKEEGANHPQRNLITRAVGADKEIDVDIYKLNYLKDDILLLCSDGLFNMVDENIILETILGDYSLSKSCQKLVDMAKEKGGLDNITLIIIKFL